MHVARDAFSGLLDLVYPPHCLICNAEVENYLCGKCIEKIDPITPPYCRKCGGPPSVPPYKGGTAGGYCEECRERQYHFEFSRSAGIFEGVLREAIHALKYHNHLAIAEPLADIMAQSYAETGLAGRAELAVPIPIHISRSIQRGFNQSEELARVFCKRVNLPLETQTLHKSRKTRRQMELPFDLRISNIRGSFKVAHEERIRGKRVLLIDDVFTTGSTLDEAARVLREAGASEVYAYTLSKSL